MDGDGKDLPCISVLYGVAYLGFYRVCWSIRLKRDVHTHLNTLYICIIEREREREPNRA